MNKEYKPRYGKYPILHPATIIVIVFFAIFLGLGYETERMKFVGVFLIPWSLWFIYIVFPFCERFYIKGNIIHTKKIRFKEVIPIPADAIFIVSYATINNSIFIKKRYIINIVVDDIDVALDRLHEDEFVCGKIAYHHGVSKNCIYDNEYIEGRFKNRFVYSFVFDKETQQVFNELKRTVILPRSLESKISIEQNGFDVIIDEGR